MRVLCRWMALAAALTFVSTGVLPQVAPPAASSPPGAATGAPQGARPPLVGEPGDPANVDEVVLPEKPALILPGSGDWDNGLKSLRDAFGRIEAELARLGIAPAGRPIAVFTQTSDDSFRFEAMIPVAAAPKPGTGLGPDMRFGVTPSGRAFRFVHRGAYDEIDTTYETITTYLEVKQIVAKDQFIEEYLNDVADQSDVGLQVNIYVQPR